MKEFYAAVNCEKFLTSLEPLREPNIPDNLDIQDGPYYKEKSVEGVLKKYDCRDDNYIMQETEEAYYVRRISFYSGKWEVRDFAIVRFKLINIKD